MGIESVGLDLDDVLFDTHPNVTRRVQEAARLMSLEIPSEPRIAEVYDYGTEMAKTLFPEADVDEFLRIAGSLDFPYQALEGAREAIEFLSRNRIRIWAFTGSRKYNAAQKFRQAGIDSGKFYPILTYDETHPYRKPHRGAWGICAQELQKAGIDITRSMYVEDGLENYNRAKEIGLQAILLLGSPNSRGYRECVLSEDVLPSMRQLPEFAARKGLVYSL